MRAFYDVEGLELVEPGFTAGVPTTRARAVDDSMVSVYGGVAFKRPARRP